MTTSRWRPHTVRDAGRQDTRLYRLEQLRASSGPTRLAALEDAALNNPASGQAVVYQASTGLWVPATPAGGVSMAYQSFTFTDGVTLLPEQGSFSGDYNPTWSSFASSGLSLTLTTTFSTHDTINFPAGLYVVSFSFNIKDPYSSTGIMLAVNSSGLAASLSMDEETWAEQTSDSLTAWGAVLGGGCCQWQGWFWFAGGGKLTPGFSSVNSNLTDVIAAGSASVLKLA